LGVKGHPLKKEGVVVIEVQSRISYCPLFLLKVISSLGAYPLMNIRWDGIVGYGCLNSA
jgi:hypothetical protein